MYVYGLLNPVTNKYFYVGVSSDLKSRLSGHMSSTDKNIGKANVIKSILKRGSRPSIVQLEYVPDEILSSIMQIEISWINKLIKDGHPLTNKSLSGAGARPVPYAKKKRPIALFIPEKTILSFGGTERLKSILTKYINEYTPKAPY